MYRIQSNNNIKSHQLNLFVAKKKSEELNFLRYKRFRVKQNKFPSTLQIQEENKG